MSVNRIVLSGGLTTDPVLRDTCAGKPVTTLRLGFTTQRKPERPLAEALKLRRRRSVGDPRRRTPFRHLSKGPGGG